MQASKIVDTQKAFVLKRGCDAVRHVPRTAYITGIEAWQLCRAGVIDPAQLGHGTTTGLFFARINSARDLLAGGKIETSAWDTWREAHEPHCALDEADLLLCDSMAQRGEQSAIEMARC